MRARLQQFLACCAAAFALAATPVAAVPVLDIAQLLSDVEPMVNLGVQDELAQGITAVSDNISGAGIYLGQSVQPTGLLTLSIWDALPNDNGAMLRSASAAAQSGWVDVFWDAVATTPSLSYFLVIESTGVGSLTGSMDNPYAGGVLYADYGYTPYVDFDYAFRTYRDSDYVANAPLPASLVLILSALTGLAALRRWPLRGLRSA